jgi:Cu(I)/Ag(I) efflux system membrane protein CusA/SilA
MSTREPIMERLLRACLENRLVVGILTFFLLGTGLLVAPFAWDFGAIARNPVPVDALPDLGENQQIVFTSWEGRSPQDVDDQITYPLTVSLLGIPGVETVRSNSFFGFSSIHVLFEEGVDFYWSRSRILERLASLPADTLPAGVQPTMGPDATALGQVFWYTLEGRDPQGRPVGGWDLDELRSVQDWQVRYALLAARGVSEVASIGGFVREYQIDVDPDAMRAFGVSITQVADAVRHSNLDVGARTLEVNGVEYFVRSIGFIEDLADIENTVVTANENVPVYLKDVAVVTTGPALRRGALWTAGSEAVGGVVVARYGDNPLATVEAVKRKIQEIAPGLPRRVLADGTISQITVVPFYDRGTLIQETLGTLDDALSQEVMITLLVVLVMVLSFEASLLIAFLLPLAILATFVVMRFTGVDANIVALSGIAIAIGTMVDVGIVISESILRRLSDPPPGESRTDSVVRACAEVISPVLTGVSTTIVSFLPVFTMEAAEGKLFRPLAFTKTFALFSSILLAIVLLPPLAFTLLDEGPTRRRLGRITGLLPSLAVVGAGIGTWFWLGGVPGTALILVGLYRIARKWLPSRASTRIHRAILLVVVLLLTFALADLWLPLGPGRGSWGNFFFVALLLFVVLGSFLLFRIFYPTMLRWCLTHKKTFLVIPTGLVLLGAFSWLGSATLLGWLPSSVQETSTFRSAARLFPGLGREFMPPLDEGAFLHMPTTMPHASIGEAMDLLQRQVEAIERIPEVETAVGKLGRVESALDPAPISMFETLIRYRPEFATDEDGRRLRFRWDEERGEFERTPTGALIPDEGGRPLRQWRSGIDDPDDIWELVERAARIPGTTGAPRLQPIAARLVMLQSGMRAPMGIKIKGPDLQSIEDFGLALQAILTEIPSIDAETVLADRIVGKPYLEIIIDREAIARHGVHMNRIQEVIEVAVGGKRLTTTVEGRERYPVRVRYLRERRDRVDSLERILVPSATGQDIPLEQLAEIRYEAGPQSIKSEDTFLVGYVVFDKRGATAEVDVIEEIREILDAKIASGDLVVPTGVSFSFAGSYENQIRAQATLTLVVPATLLIIFLILYLQFRNIGISLLVFSSVFVAWSGGFLLLWLYGQNWFFDLEVFGTNLRDLFSIRPYNLSIAVWVGFLALFGIATDDGVLLASHLDQSFMEAQPDSVPAIHEATVRAGERRIRPCLMTSATTLLALTPILTSTGRGADVMVPMAIPAFGGMCVVLISVFVVPVLYAAVAERRLAKPT